MPDALGVNTVDMTARVADGDCAPGVFVCGRQHSGNTMLASLLGRLDGYVSTLNEEMLFECRPMLDTLPDAAARAQWVGRHLNLDQPQLESRIGEALCAWANAHPSADALAVFQKAAALCAELTGNRCWARKATSYIFHADIILREMPNVKLIYLLRNPFDLCASVKRRHSEREHVVGPVLSWSSGTLTALRYEREYPDRFHVIRYEKLVNSPEEKIRRLCKFLGVHYDPSLLDVPQINFSDKPYELASDQRGFTASRIYGYMKHLTPAEILAAQMLCNRGLLERLYPQLPHQEMQWPLVTRFKAIGLIAAGWVRYPMMVFLHARKHAFPMGAYIKQRLGVYFSSRRSVARRGTLVIKPSIAGLIAVLLGVIFTLMGLSALAQ